MARSNCACPSSLVFLEWSLITSIIYQPLNYTAVHGTAVLEVRKQYHVRQQSCFVG